MRINFKTAFQRRIHVLHSPAKHLHPLMPAPIVDELGRIALAELTKRLTHEFAPLPVSVTLAPRNSRYHNTISSRTHHVQCNAEACTEEEWDVCCVVHEVVHTVYPPRVRHHLRAFSGPSSTLSLEWLARDLAALIEWVRSTPLPPEMLATLVHVETVAIRSAFVAHRGDTGPALAVDRAFTTLDGVIPLQPPSRAVSS
ncbi:hypothetical protein QEG98_42060 (plasmid) [Myxococcus sp. MxC21-1]|uniref:hypothetical protein n=1 Tax=Myxococcus sp. MxC21-1 TaxID=3041439 RepID=UPI00292CB31C|nr:hypothetical protein [Myxococcus sp. MxC21-1]WNZ66206.1 hypothetical protein QEG98_42060 [Myxococcus sp. MxC21-1]